MAKKPYPGWNPNLKIVDNIDHKQRTCLIIEIRSKTQLLPKHLVALTERLEATMARCESIIPGLELEVITPDRFDPVVCEGLRLTRIKDDGSPTNSTK